MGNTTCRLGLKVPARRFIVRITVAILLAGRPVRVTSIEGKAATALQVTCHPTGATTAATGSKAVRSSGTAEAGPGALAS